MGSRANVSICIVSNMWPSEWVWESNGSKLEGMYEWLNVCVYLRVKQYPEALLWSHWFTAHSCCTPRYTFYSHIPSLRHGTAAAPRHAHPNSKTQTGGGHRGAHHYSEKQIGHPNKTQFWPGLGIVPPEISFTLYFRYNNLHILPAAIQLGLLTVVFFTVDSGVQ